MTSPAALILQLAFADPAAALRLPLPPPPALRIALGARLAAHGGQVQDHPQALVSLHRLPSAAHAGRVLQAAFELLSQGTQRLVEDLPPTALRLVLLGLVSDDDGARAAAQHRAQRILSFSRDHSLLISRDLYTCLSPALRDHARLATPPSLVDQQPDLKDLFELDWPAAAHQQAQDALATAPPAQPGLSLSHGDTELKLSPADCPLTLGRDKSCGLKLDGDVASRVHGRIEFERGQFYFVDDSRNGSYLLTPSGADEFLHRERLPLNGRGVISPGAPLVRQTGELVHYRLLGRADADTQPPAGAERHAPSHH